MEYYLARRMNKEAPTIHENMNESHRRHYEQKKSDTKENVLHKTTNTKTKSRQTQSVLWKPEWKLLLERNDWKGVWEGLLGAGHVSSSGIVVFAFWKLIKLVQLSTCALYI